MTTFRQRTYARYVESADGPFTPGSVDDLASRAPTMRYMVEVLFPADTSAAILDVGCGHGQLIDFARRAGYSNISGVDVSGQQVALARERGIEHVHEGDLLDTLKSTAAASLDAVVAFDVIEHFTKSELVDFADAVHVALKPGGRWIIHTVNAASPFFGAVRHGDFTHEQAFTTTSLRQVLNAAAFARVEFAECRPRVHGLASLIRACLWWWIRLFYRLVLAVETGDNRHSVLTQNLYAVACK